MIILAIAVLALLFIIGSTLLIVSSQQREAAQQSIQTRQLRAIDEALTNNTMMQFRGDLVGR